jgi:carbonic anhydrase
MATGPAGGVRHEVLWVEQAPEDLPPPPATAREARKRLDRGNKRFVRAGVRSGRHEIAVGPEAFGLPRVPGRDLVQEPFAAVLGCADARVPVELVFGQATNNLFVVRVAGNVPSTECVGSLHFAVRNMPSVRLVAVLGHSQCGAVTAAVDSLLVPQTYLAVAHDPPLRAIVDALVAGVRLAALALEEVHGPRVGRAAGFRAALISCAVLANAAITALVLDRDLDRDVVFGVYDLHDRTVGTPGADGWEPGLAAAPGDQDLAALMRNAATHVEV